MSRLRMLAILLIGLPGARTDVEIEAFCWVSNQLFWRLTEAAAVDREAVERTVTAFFWHALFND